MPHLQNCIDSQSLPLSHLWRLRFSSWPSLPHDRGLHRVKEPHLLFNIRLGDKDTGSFRDDTQYLHGCKLRKYYNDARRQELWQVCNPISPHGGIRPYSGDASNMLNSVPHRKNSKQRDHVRRRDRQIWNLGCQPLQHGQMVEAKPLLRPLPARVLDLWQLSKERSAKFTLV